jgi:hypothetical protein
LIVLLAVAVPVGLFLPQNWPLSVRELVALVAVFAGLILWERISSNRVRGRHAVRRAEAARHEQRSRLD